MHRLVSHTIMSNKRGYVVNLDPAVMSLPFGANIDIRDTVRYKEVMKEFNLGPNGGILTSLNLFSTKFDEVKLISQSSLNFALVNLHVTPHRSIFRLYCFYWYWNFCIHYLLPWMY